MTIILTSLLRHYCYGEDGTKIPVALVNANGILDNIKTCVPHTRKLVFVANDPADTENNDFTAQILSKSFALAGFPFAETTILDGRNADNAAQICRDASLIYLRGGKCICQLDFLKKIKFDGIIRNSTALIIGTSAGAMNLGATVANFPEEPSDLPDPRFLAGLGVTDKTVIPHFDKAACAYQFPCEHFDIAKDYVLPMSNGRTFWGVANDGYILIEQDGEIKTFGDVCLIKNGKIENV